MKTSSRSIAAKAARRGGEAGSSPRKRAVREVLTGAVCAAIGVALCAILGRAVVLGLLLTGATPAQAAQSADSAAVASPAATESTTWPRDIPTPDGTIRMFEPQVESLVGDTLVSRAAISLTRPGGNALAVFGAVRFTAKIRTEGRAKSAALEQVVVTRVLLPDLGDAEEARVRASLEGSLAKLHPTIATDRLASAVDSAKGTDQGQPAFGNAPPRILVSKQPAVLMLIDGKPERRPIEGTNLEQIVNTPFAVIYQPSAQRYFTSNGRFWYSAIEPTGPWTTVPEPPVEIAKAVAESRQKAEEARRAVGGTSDAAADAAGSSAADGGLGSSATAPAIVVSTEPAELLVFGGEPSWAPLTGTDLLVAMNTPSDVFVEISTQRRFVLLAGRWFVAQSLDGPWSFVAADQLPADFATIPPETAKAYVRASVAGTPEAQDAVLQTQIPQTTAIDRRTAKLDVSYDGAPRFEAIPGTEVAYAVNSGAQVLKIHDRFFAVDQGVWFTAPGPDGPWEVADQRPPEVESIPPSSPVYNTRYVYVYDSTPEYVQVGYLPGYVGSYVYGPTVVYGTGYRYRPWYGASFYARPYTWGFGVRYVPWWGYTWFDDPYSDFLWVGWGWGSSHHHHHHHHDCPPGWYGPAGPRPVYRPPPTYRPPPQPGHVPPPPSSFSRGPRPPAASHNLYVAPRNLPRVAPVATQQPRSYVAPATTPARPSYPASMRPSPSTRPSVTPAPAPAPVPGASQPRSQPPSTYVPPSSTPSSKPGAGWSTPSHKPPSVAPRPGTPSPAAPRSPLPPSTPAAPPSNFGGANREGRDGGDGRSTPDGAPDARPGYTPPSLPRGGAATPGSGGSFPSQPRSQPWSPNVEPRERRAAPIDRGEDARPSSAWLPRARPAAGWSQPEPRYQPRYEPRVEEPVIDRGTAVADPRYVPRGNRQTVEASRSYPQREVAPPRAIQSSNQGGRGGWSGRSTQVEEARVAMPSMRAPEPERIRVPPPEPQPVAERSQPRGYSAPAAAERPAPRSFEQRAPSGFMPSSRPMPSYGAPSANRGGNPPRHR